LPSSSKKGLIGKKRELVEQSSPNFKLPPIGKEVSSTKEAYKENQYSSKIKPSRVLSPLEQSQLENKKKERRVPKHNSLLQYGDRDSNHRSNKITLDSINNVSEERQSQASY
jgi:hypothetical protein